MFIRRFMQSWFRLLGLTFLAGALFVGALATSAHETDNFCLPLDADLADLGPFLEMVHTIALQEAVGEVNADIEKALRIKNDTARARKLERLHHPLALSKAFIGRFNHPMVEDSRVEQALRGSWARRTYSGQKPTYQDLWMNFSAHSPLDLRRWMMLTQSRTVKACGIYFGTDKLVHFHHLGEDYFRKYHSLLQSGLDHEAALREVLEHFTRLGLWSEEGMFGVIVTGAYSNADLAANLAGFKFYLNLTEKVVLKGEERQPLVERSGVFWRLNRHVRPRSGWLGAFISDHWNEALNPNRYDSFKRSGIQRVLRSRAREIVRFYTQKDGRPNDPAYFDNLARELSTYYGEPYGHSGQLDSLLTIGNTCFPALDEAGVEAGSQ